MRKAPPSRQRKSVGTAISIENRRAAAAKGFELAIFLLCDRSVSLIPLKPILAQGDGYEGHELDGVDESQVMVIHDDFGNTYLAKDDPVEKYASWDQAFEEYLKVAAQFRSFPAVDREGMLGVLVSGVCGQDEAWEISEETAIVRINDLADPLGFSPIDVSDRIHTCRMRMLEFDIETEEEDEDDGDEEEYGGNNADQP